MYSLTFNGVDFGDFGFIVAKSNWPLTATPRVDIQPVAFGAGVSHRNYFQPREFDIAFIMQATDEDQLVEYINDLSLALVTDSDKPLSFDRFRPGIFWNARYTGGLESIEYLNATTISGSIQFTCADPIGFDSTERSIPNVTINEDPKTYILESSTPVAGNQYTRPVYIAKATNGANSLVLANVTTGETLTWAGILGNGDWLRIDSERFIVEVSVDSGGTWATSMTGVSGTFPRLKGGVLNTLTIDGIAVGGSMTITYRGRYM